MRRETCLADEIEVLVSGIFTTHYVLYTDAGILGGLTLSALRMERLFHGIDGRSLSLRRTSWWRGTYELREEDTVLSRAEPRGILRRQTAVQFRDQTYRLRRAGFWGRTWHLVDASGAIVVKAHPRGVFRRDARLGILQPVDVDLLVFTYHLVNARWQEQTTVASTGSAH